MNTDLTQKKCVPCEGGTKPLTREEFSEYLAAVPQWEVIEDDHKITRSFTLKNFAAVLASVNKVGALAEEEGHHPDILMHDWKMLTINLTTHAISGLSINDFILAAKIDQLMS